MFHTRKPASARASRPPPPRTVDDGVQAHERELHELLCTKRRLEERIAVRDALRKEELATQTVRASLLAAERQAAGDPAALRSIALQRERARRISVQLQELDEERQTLQVCGRSALDARLRSAVARERVDTLTERLRSSRSGAGEAHGRELAKLESALADHEREEKLRPEREVAEEASRAAHLAHCHELIEELLDETEGARQLISRLDGAVDASAVAQRVAARRAATAAATATPSAAAAAPEERRRLALHREVEKLGEEVAALQRAEGERDAEQQATRARVTRENERLRADAISTREDIERLESELQRRQAAGGRAACGPPPSTARAAAPTAPPPPRKPASAGGVGAARTVSARPPSASGRKLTDEQRARLDALKGKYGESVAANLAARLDGPADAGAAQDTGEAAAPAP